MAEETAVIEHQMEATRQALAEKVEALEKQVVATVHETTQAVSDTVSTVTGAVQETVGNVTDTVQKTVDTVKETFDFRKQVEHHPWVALGGAVAVGYLAGAMLFPRSPAQPSWSQESEDQGEGTWAAASTGSTVPCPSEQEVEAQSHAKAGHETSADACPADSCAEQQSSLFSGLAPVLGRLKEMAIGTTTGVIGEMIRSALPEQMRDDVTKVVDRFTTALGGTPIRRHG